MKKKLYLLMCLVLAVLLMAGCGQSSTGGATATAAPAEQAPAQAAAEWTRQGIYQDQAGNMASVTWMDDVDEPGWYVGFMNGEDLVEDSFGGMLKQEGAVLRGTLSSEGAKGDITVTVSEDGEAGVQIAVEGGETYRFTPMEIEDPFCTVTVSTEGLGRVNYAEGEEAPDLEGERYTFFAFPLEGPTTLTFGARGDEDGWFFVKWTLNGEDYTTEPVFTAEVTEDSDFVAVFDWSGDDGQNPVMNVIGPYVSDRARAQVECLGDDSAKITIEWSGSAWDLARWVMSGRFDTETLTVEYTDCVKTIVTYADDGSVVSEEVEYENGTGRVVFDGESGFTWKGDQSEQEDLVFEWSWDPEGSN